MTVEVAEQPGEAPVAVVDLALGGKVISLTGVGIEWLLQPEGGRPRDQTFLGSGLSGWDECIPTVSACSAPDGRWLQDHGTVWSRAWHRDPDGFATVETDHFVFGRRLTTVGNALLAEYRVRSVTAVSTSLLWASHPQVLAPAGTVVEVAVDRVLEVYPGPERLTSWSSVSAIDSLRVGQCRKVYLKSAERVAAARILRPDGRWLRFAWDSDLVPHLGIWFDVEAFAPSPVIAVEPAIGWYDSLARASSNGTAMTLAPGQHREWWLSVSVGR